jgi:hypothetical protein
MMMFCHMVRKIDYFIIYYLFIYSNSVDDAAYLNREAEREV